MCGSVEGALNWHKEVPWGPASLSALEATSAKQRLPHNEALTSFHCPHVSPQASLDLFHAHALQQQPHSPLPHLYLGWGERAQLPEVGACRLARCSLA